MGRAIIAAQAVTPQVAARGVPDADAAPSSKNDRYSDKLLKLVPAEVITGYVALDQMLKTSPDEIATIVPWLVFGLGMAATWLMLRFTLGVTDWRQLAMTVVAFCVWAMALSDPITGTVCADMAVGTCAWNETYSKLLLASYTFIAPLVPMGQEDAAR